MSWVIAIAGFIALIVLHELGHFVAAKALGMRVERFSLFFPPKIAGFTRGDTEYMLGALPLGGYVKITGMSPDEVAELDPALAERAYYNKAPWKRIVVILAGPGVNLLIAVVLFTAVLLSGSLDGANAIGNIGSQRTLSATDTTMVGGITKHSGASGHLEVGDRILAIDGRRASTSTTTTWLRGTHCAGKPTNGCAATVPVSVTVVRHGRTEAISVLPHYSSAEHRMLLGVTLDAKFHALHFGVAGAISTSVAALWSVGTSTVTDYVRAFTSSKVRRQLSSVVGITHDTQEAVARGPAFALVVLGLVSLVLAVVNLFPFLPLDGGHVLWSVVEKLRGRRVSLTAMWRYSSVGIVLLAFLVLNGISNDISRLGG